MKFATSRCSFGRAAASAVLLAQLAAGHAGVFAGALAAGFLGHGHGHELSLSGDVGHVDVVLHHGDCDDPVDATGPGAASHDGDHVVHLAALDRALDGKPRVAAPTFGLLVVAPVAPAESRSLALRDVPADAAGPSALLRTIVLRI